MQTLFKRNHYFLELDFRFLLNFFASWQQFQHEEEAALVYLGVAEILPNISRCTV
jgi:hypothetical protein